MANPEHLKILKQGVEVWNKWREENPDIQPDLSDLDLKKSSLQQVNFFDTNLSRTNLSDSNLIEANFSFAQLTNSKFIRSILVQGNFTAAHLQGVDFTEAVLAGSDLSGSYVPDANFSKAMLIGVDLSRTYLKGSTFVGSNLNEAKLVEIDMSGVDISNSSIYGISAWNIKKENLVQKNLIITLTHEPEITVDDLEVAQFIYLLLNNQNIRNVIDTITSKAVLILGRFTDERKQVLDALKNELRRRNYLPIVFDFDPLQSRDITETVSILAKMSRFVVADLSDPRSIPQELREIVPNTPSLPIVPIILDSQREYGMFEHFTRYPWVLPVYRYASQASLLDDIVPAIITPAEQKVEELRRK